MTRGEWQSAVSDRLERDARTGGLDLADRKGEMPFGRLGGAGSEVEEVQRREAWYRAWSVRHGQAVRIARLQGSMR